MNLYLMSAIGGMMIGAATIWLMATLGRVAGISGIVGHAMIGRGSDRAWRIAFLTGLVAGPALLGFVSGNSGIGAPVAPWPWMLGAGLLVGIGTRLSNGCTSGHGVCGLARLSPRSLLATATFMATAIVTTYALHHLGAGVQW